MRKLVVVSLIVMFAAIAGAATVITYTIPNAKAQKIIAAFTAQDGATVRITIQRRFASRDPNSPACPAYHANILFDLPLRDPNVSDIVYVKKRNGLIADAFVRLHERQLRSDANVIYDNARPVIDVNEPSGIE